MNEPLPAYRDLPTDYTEPPSIEPLVYKVNRIKSSNDATITLNRECVFYVQFRRHVVPILTGLRLTVNNSGSLWSMASWSYNFQKHKHGKANYILDSSFSTESNRRIYKIKSASTDMVFDIINGHIFKWEYSSMKFVWKKVLPNTVLLEYQNQSIAEYHFPSKNNGELKIDPNYSEFNEIILVTGFSVSQWEME
ncbi:hypothetical protein HDV06_001071 [Boothiomyces sp. JEL0866]|nr:hypothetical protein HDV06_001071 [Boothiomyces sp. JEL0866]